MMLKVLPQNKVYKPRKPKEIPLWKCIQDNFTEFIQTYEVRYEQQYGYFRLAIEKVVEKFIECGDLKNGFARVKCPDCKHEYLLAFSCRGRWFCPSCHQKKVILFGEFIKDTVSWPVPHRQYVLSIPKMLRIYFRNDRKLLTKLCQIAQESILQYMKISMNKVDGEIGIVMAIQTFGEYLNFHPHIHAVVADGLFTKSGMFYVMPSNDINNLEKIFQHRVIKMLIDEGLLVKEMAQNLLHWKNSGFSVYKSPQIKRHDKKGLEKISQYIIRNTFNEDKMIYNDKSKIVVYRSKKHFSTTRILQSNKQACNSVVNTKRNFEVFTACDFIASLTQHIPDKGFQLVRYYGWYSNKERGMRKKRKIISKENKSNKAECEIIDISDYQPIKVPTKRWRELIKKIWELDPLACPKCNGEMSSLFVYAKHIELYKKIKIILSNLSNEVKANIISFINSNDIIEKILKHLGLWEENIERAPPLPIFLPFEDNSEYAVNCQLRIKDIIFEPAYDDFQSASHDYALA